MESDPITRAKNIKKYLDIKTNAVLEDSTRQFTLSPWGCGVCGASPEYGEGGGDRGEKKREFEFKM